MQNFLLKSERSDEFWRNICFSFLQKDPIMGKCNTRGILTKATNYKKE